MAVNHEGTYWCQIFFPPSCGILRPQRINWWNPGDRRFCLKLSRIPSLQLTQSLPQFSEADLVIRTVFKCFSSQCGISVVHIAILRMYVYTWKHPEGRTWYEMMWFQWDVHVSHVKNRCTSLLVLWQNQVNTSMINHDKPKVNSWIHDDVLIVKWLSCRFWA